MNRDVLHLRCRTAARYLFLLAAVLLAAAAAEPLRGQSALGIGGLGVPVEPVGARARGMGSLGVALFGSELMPGDPAGARALRVPMLTATYQPTWYTRSFRGEELEAATSRFPLLGGAYPVSRFDGMATLTFGGFLDQNWRVERETSVEFSDRTVPVTDRFTSEGGVAVVRLGWAQSAGERLDLAVSAGAYVGDVERTFTRSFDTTAVGADVQTFTDRGEWRFSGPTLSAGARWDPHDLIRLGGSVSWSGDLRMEADEGTDAPSGEIAVPTALRFGASGALSPRLSLNVGLSHADWSDAAEGVAGTSGAGAVWSLGGGVEWEGPMLLGRSFPLRAGYRWTEYPFRFEGADPAESAFTAGLGMNLVEAEDLPLASIDLALETGERSAADLSESFSRVTVTVRVAGR